MSNPAKSFPPGHVDIPALLAAGAAVRVRRVGLSDYVAIAPPGSKATDPVWQVRKITYIATVGSPDYDVTYLLGTNAPIHTATAFDTPDFSGLVFA